MIHDYHEALTERCEHRNVKNLHETIFTQFTPENIHFTQFIYFKRQTKTELELK